MLNAIGNKIFGSKNERELKNLWPIADQINQLEAEFEELSLDQLKAKTPEFKQRIDNGESLDSLLPEAFATVREVSKRTLGMRHFDVQLIGGVVLHRGIIAEMKTGEGKTLCATLPVYLNALSGKGVHVVTVNDYLAKRDAEWMATIYGFLGLSTGVIVNNIGHQARIKAYDSDITYGQNNEFGFDYLRDNMKLELAEKVQRSYNYAIVDEVDSILIDEARTPLIISGPVDDKTELYQVADQAIPRLKEEHYEIELKSKQISLTDDGVKEVEKILGIGNLFDPSNISVLHHINQALKAHKIFVKDVDYVVRNNEVMIVDEFTGRLMSGRRWSDGLHQAVEAKERVEIQRENQTLASITFQNYFRMYDKLAGMTGTADTEAVEFKKIYNLDVTVIPTNKPTARNDFADVIYASKKGKFNAVAKEIKEMQDAGRPVLVGTANIATSEMVATLLKKEGIKHHVLNAKHHQQEAEIVAQAGRKGAVTISTNMAGRGTDILLGGNPEFLAASEFDEADPEDSEYKERLDFYKRGCEEEKKEILEAGGLHILGTERHESRRIDNQLRGRAGRQGDPGSSRFYVSLEDELMLRFGGEKMQALMGRVGMTEEDAIEGTLVARAIENAQKKVEGYHFDIRKHLLEYDDVMNKQREVIYKLRERVLQSEHVENDTQEMISDLIEDMILMRSDEKIPVHDWDIEGVFPEFNKQFGFAEKGDDFISRKEEAGKEIAQEVFEYLRDLAQRKYEQRKNAFGEEQIQKLGRIIYLQGIDYFWKEHLANMDHLREGIGWRSLSQKNPLHEYQREGFEMFSSMMINIKSFVIQNLFSVELVSEEQLREIEEQEKQRQAKREAAASSVHEEFQGSEQKGQGDSSLNRKQRRQVEQSESGQAVVNKSHTDKVMSSISKSSKQSKNKAKAARKARRKGR